MTKVPSTLDDTGTAGRLRLAGMLAIGLIAISFASIFIKLCRAPSLTIAVYRLAIAAGVYLLVVRWKSGRFLPGMPGTHLRVVLLSGAFLTVHFTTWITSLSYTSVASSVVLVQSAPVFVAIGSALFLGEKPAPLAILGILTALAGSVLIGIHDFRLDGTSLTGDLLAVCGAVGAAGYILAGRNLRRHLDTFTYVAFVYSTSAVLLLVLTMAAGTPLAGFDRRTWLLLAAIAVFPQIIGHTTFNWALEHLSATAVSIILLGEPVGASILALVLLGEPLGFGTVTGGAVILAGVALVLGSESRGRRVHVAMPGVQDRAAQEEEASPSESSSR